MDNLSDSTIDQNLQNSISIQDYTKKPTIAGVEVKEIRNFVGEDGDFCEILRFNEQGEVEGFPGFRVKQVNRSKMMPNAIKAWHLHYQQDEAQTVRPEDHLVVGLWDVREDSPTKGVTMKLVLGGGKAHMIYIPKGVAHGYMNISQKDATILYFVSEQFNMEDPDERRLPWNSIEGFWERSHE